jgi:hypothetical protein
VVSGIIEGKAWLIERRRFLQDELAKDPPEDQRDVIASELAAVDQELASKRHRWWRRLLGGFQDGT